MICSIIDIGSNTIRLSVYQLQEGTIIPLLHKKTMAGLASYIQDGWMSEEGIHTAIRVLNQYRSLLEHLSIQQVSVFATASLREISNTCLLYTSFLPMLQFGWFKASCNPT